MRYALCALRYFVRADFFIDGTEALREVSPTFKHLITYASPRSTHVRKPRRCC